MKNFLFSIFLTCFFVGYAQSDFSTRSTQELLAKVNSLGHQAGDVSQFFSKAELSQLQAYYQSQGKMNVNLAGENFFVTGGASTGYGVETQADGFMSFDPVTGSGITSISSGSGTTGFEGAGAISNDDPTTGYAIDTNGVLYSINVATGAYTNLGNIGILNMNGMEFAPSGTLYANDGTNLYTINTTTPSATLVGPLGAGVTLAVALAIDGDGVGYTYDLANDSFYSINLATGAATLIGVIGFDANFGQGMAWDASTDTVYMAAFNNSTFMAEWRSVNVSTGMSTLIGNMVGTGALTQVAWVSVVGESTGPAEGCLDAENGQYPSTTFVPACNGVPQGTTEGLAWTGEYTMVQVTSGTEYIFSLSDPSYFVTIGDSTGTTVLASGTGSVTWTSNVTGTVRFYAHFDSDCNFDSETFLERFVQCGEVPPPPSDCEDYEVLSNNLENGLFFGGDTAQHLATDIPVGDTGFTIYGMEPTVIGEATSFEFIIYSDAAGLPGTELETRTGSIVDSEVTGNNFGFDFIKYTVGFDTPLALSANTTYWIEIISDADGWESTSVSSIGYGDVFYNSNVGEGVWTSTGGDEMVFNLICDDLGVSDMSSFDFAYYPNPVKDELNITSKKLVQSVSVYNLAGQQVSTQKLNVTNGKISTSALAPGVYVFRAVLDGGQIETFKVIKK